MRPLLLLLPVAVGTGLSTGCSKGEASTQDPPVVLAAGEAPAASGVRSAGAAPVGPSAPGAPGTLADAACGAPPGGSCVLRDWMNAHMAPAVIAGDFDALKGALDQTVAFAPDGYPNWRSIARDGADAARTQDLGAVKAACRSCHAQYRDRYRRELGDRPL
ncbi:MAG TPA: hypothetical protein VEK07_01795 [Polyangiaceae bacterium]|nr:hypothetical protein [Polyangiaceae bacterium]